MKTHHILLATVLASTTLLAQTTTGQAGSTATNPHAQHHPSAAQTGTQPNTAQPGMGGHMAAMQADLQQMKSQVAQMRADAEKVQDVNTRAALMQNAAMWEQFLNRMQTHMQMRGHGTMGQGMMGPGMMGQGANTGCQMSASGGCPMMQGQTPPANPTPPPPKPE
jgi:TolA-binding protein